MKKIIYILFATVCFNLNAATRYCVAGGTGNWNSTTNWSTASGGASGASFPVSGDIAIFDVNSPNLTINTFSGCDTLTCTSYTGTLTWNSTLTAITATFGTGMTISGTSGTLFMAGGSGRFNANGVTLTCNFEIGEAPLTLISNVTINGTLSTAFNVSVTGTHTINVGSNFSQFGDLTVTGGYTLTINMTGASATWSASNNRMGATLIYNNAAGTFTLSGTCQLYQFGNLTTTAASVVTTGSTLNIIGLNAFINTPNVAYNNIQLEGPSAQLAINSSGVSIGGTLTLNTGVLNGTYGCTINNLTITNNGANQLGAGLTYIVNGALTCIGTSGAHGNLASTSSTNAILTLTGTQNMRFCNGTHIDSSGGIQIHSVGAVLSNTINWAKIQSNFNTFN